MHRQIYQAIRVRDRARAQELMFEHLARAEREQESETASAQADVAAS
jgi:DNA-binding FadR family transcriptional regulator